MKIRFLKKKLPSITLTKNFPDLYRSSSIARRSSLILHEVIAAIVAGLSAWWATASAAITGITVSGVVYGVPTMILNVSLIGGSLIASYAASRSKKPTARNSNGLQVNSRRAEAGR